MESLVRVNGKPYFMIGGQTHNSSTTTRETMNQSWQAIEKLGMNTIAAPVYWMQVEPEEGQFCFDQIDWIIDGARQRGLHAVILWFGTWKNGTSHYVPQWVKRDKRRFLWSQSLSGALTRILSPLGEETLAADIRAFEKVMAYIRDKNEDGIVLAVQVENEPGSVGTPRDYSETGNAAFAQNVPQVVVDWLKVVPDCYLKLAWQKQGAKEEGNWEALFGVDGTEVFSAYYVSRYVNAVAHAGRQVYDIPMYVNVWLGEMYNRVAGIDFPSGGATCHMIDLWKMMTPDIDLIAPDIYLQDYRTYDAVCSVYARNDNPLYIPESPASTMNALNVFTEIAERNLTGIHIFGVDSLFDAKGEIGLSHAEFAHAVKILSAARPLLERYVSTGKIYAVAQYEGCSTINFDFGDYLGRAACYSASGSAFAEPAGFMDTFHMAPEDYAVRAKGLIFDAGDGVFYIVGEGFRLTFTRKDNIDQMAASVRASTFLNGRHGEYLSVEEGTIAEDGRFVSRRERCGDETDNGIWTHWDVGVIRVVMDR